MEKKQQLEKVIIELLNEQGELYKTLQEMFAENSVEEPRGKDEDLRAEIAKTLRNLGIRTNVKGYRFLLEAVELWIEGREGMVNIYNEVAKINRTRPHCVERALRHAIESGWEEANEETVKKIFGCSFSKNPTNSQFVSAVAEFIENSGQLV